MAEKLSVYVTQPKGRDIFQMRYRDPSTGKETSRSTKCKKRREAERVAAVWQDELRRGAYISSGKTGWTELVDHYASHVLTGLSDNTAATYFATFNVFEKLATPRRASDLTTDRITRFVQACRAKGLAEATIARHLRALKVLARWAHEQELLTKVPKFTMPKRARGSKSMKGRPITLREFNDMLRVLPEVPGAAANVDAWRFYLKGLWCSGLRLSESLRLRWDDGPDAIVVDTSSGKHPLFRIAGEAQKSGKDQMLPMVPEFARLLEEVPSEDRLGHVFKVGTSRHTVGPIVSAIGERADIVVDSKSGKHASAHDLRRAFGFRWSRKIMPAVLMELMRHANITTTMEYYVGDDAQRTAAELWKDESRPAAHLAAHGESEKGEVSGNPLF